MHITLAAPPSVAGTYAFCSLCEVSLCPLILPPTFTHAHHSSFTPHALMIVSTHAPIKIFISLRRLFTVVTSTFIIIPPTHIHHCCFPDTITVITLHTLIIVFSIHTHTHMIVCPHTHPSPSSPHTDSSSMLLPHSPLSLSHTCQSLSFPITHTHHCCFPTISLSMFPIHMLIVVPLHSIS